jgi:hypothetical protein
MAKANNGKQLEQLVGLIHEATKETSQTTVHTNVKLKNTSGVDREFDIIIQSVVSDVKITIAIECKDYNKAVSVEKLEAFKGKCDRIPSINKKVFVSASGYQRDAINAAKDFGIALYELKDIAATDIASWFPFQQIAIRFEITDFQFYLKEQITVNKLSEYNGNVYFRLFNERKNVIEFLNDEITAKREKFWALKLRSFIRAKEKDRFEKECYQVNLNFEPGSGQLETEEGEFFNVHSISVAADFWMIKVDTTPLLTKEYISSEGKRTGYMAIDGKNDGKVEIVLTNNKFNIFYTDEAGQKQRMAVLGKYDPKTDIYTKIAK